MKETRSHDPFVAGLQAGEEHAVAELLERYWAPAYRVALRLCAGDAAAAEDVAQEAMLKVLRGVDRFEVGRDFRPWFFRIVNNAAREHLRKGRRRERHEHQVPVAPSAATAEGIVSEREDLGLVRRHLDGLPEHYRAALTLRFLEDLSLREVADALGCAEGTVSSRIRRGLEALRGSLGPALASGLAITVLLPQVAEADEIPAAPEPSALLARKGGVAPAPVPPATVARPLKSWALLPLLAAGAVGLTLLLLAALLASPKPSAPALATREALEELRNTPAAAELGPPPVAQDPGDGHDHGSGADQTGDPAPTADPAPATVSGRLSLAGRPFPNAIVRLRKDGSDLILPRGHRFETRADPDGRFAFDPAALPQDASFWLLEVEVGGQRPFFNTAGEAKPVQALRLESLTTDPVQLELIPIVATGVVLDAATDAPLPEARVTLFGQQARCDGAGRFRLQAAQIPWLFVPTLSATAPGYSTAGAGLDLDRETLAPATASDLVLRLPRGRSVQGRLVDERGVPVAGVDVTLGAMIPVSHPTFSNMKVGHAWGATSGADGSFAIEGLPLDAAVDVRVHTFDDESGEFLYRPYERKAVSVGAEPLEIVLHSVDAPAHTGRIVGPGGEGLGGAIVVSLGAQRPGPDRFSLTYRDGDRVVADRLCSSLAGSPLEDMRGGSFGNPGELEASVTTDSGRFRLQSGVGPVLVRKPGFVDRMVESPTQGQTIRLAAATPITGTIQTSAGEPVAHAMVFAYPSGTLSNLSGTAVLEHPEHGLHQVPATPFNVFASLARTAGPTPLAAAVTDREGRYRIDSAPADCDLVANTLWPFLQREAAFTVLSQPKAGSTWSPTVDPLTISQVRVRPLAADTGADLTESARLTFLSPEGKHSHWSLDSGAFAVPTSGDLILEVRAPGRRAVRRPFQLQPGRELDLGDVHLHSGVGSVSVSAPQPRAGNLFLHVVEANGAAQLIEAPNLETSLPDLTPGPCSVTPFLRDGAPPQETLRRFPTVQVDVIQDRITPLRLDLR